MSVSLEESMNDQLKARNWKDEFEAYVDASDLFRKRVLKNFGFYDGVDYGHWDPDVVKALLEEGKPAHTFNWIQNLIDLTQGHLNQEPIGIDFLQYGQGLKKQGDLLQSLYDMDYSRGRYQKQFDEFIRNALIVEGVLQLTWDTSDDRLGNVGIISKNPKHIIKDPYWNSDDISDCRAIFTYSWLTV